MWEGKCDTRHCVKGQWVFGEVYEGCRVTFLMAVQNISRNADCINKGKGIPKTNSQ